MTSSTRHHPGGLARVSAAATGAFTSGDPVHLQSTGFVLTPDSRVAVSVYSSGVIGRPYLEARCLVQLGFASKVRPFATTGGAAGRR
jgi:hypothetical protein